MAVVDLTGLSSAQARVATLERAKALMIEKHNQVAASLSIDEFTTWQKETFMPQMNELMGTLAVERGKLSEITTYDARINLDI